jgi:hypothetical protein
MSMGYPAPSSRSPGTDSGTCADGRSLQAVSFPELPDHLARLALFKSNTGTREDEVCGLRWDWEVPELETSVFLVPGDKVKSSEEDLLPSFPSRLCDIEIQQHG